MASERIRGYDSVTDTSPPMKVSADGTVATSNNASVDATTGNPAGRNFQDPLRRLYVVTTAAPSSTNEQAADTGSLQSLGGQYSVLILGIDGIVKVVTFSGQTATLALSKGIHPISVTRVFATGTDSALLSGNNLYVGGP